MSRAFVKEPDNDSPEDLPDLPISSQPNYVTPEGLAHLRQRLNETQRRSADMRDNTVGQMQERARTERDIRWLQARIASARLVTAEGQSSDQVGFGATVTLAENDGRTYTYRIVGEDEADPARGLVSWASPLARALVGAQVGHVVTWQRPAGSIDVEVQAIRYDVPPPAI
ncbi:MAG: GreA/GreB family elongation factor [Gammaproteobacteria bacterium]|nr:GreA/GreB family elongation factor [Gammaproteobacteria bacterium]